MTQEVECQLCLGKELVPEKVWKRVRDSSKYCQKVRFESANGSLCYVAAMDMRRNKLEGAFPFVLDDKFVGLACLVVEDLKIHGVSALFQAGHDAVVRGDAMAVVP